MNPNLIDDASLDPMIEFPVPDLRHEPHVALLTGATGFLGSYLLSDLLAHTNLKVVCLARASGAIQGMARVRAVLESSHLSRETFADRIQVVTGDLAQPRLGLSDSQFELLGREVEVIYHSGAEVNFIAPYRILKPANVTGTHEMLRLAAIPPSKRFHFVSSTRVFPPPKRNSAGPIHEDFYVGSPPPGNCAYADSKWAAERLVNAAAARGLPSTIYRPGRITGHSVTGACAAKDLLTLMLKSCLRLGVAPEFCGTIQLTPVDFVSRTMVQLSLDALSSGKAFHLINPGSIDWMRIIKILGDISHVDRSVPYAEWRAMLRDKAGEDKNIAWTLAALDATHPPFPLSRPDLSVDNTVAGLKKASWPKHPLDQNLLVNRYITYLSSLIER